MVSPLEGRNILNTSLCPGIWFFRVGFFSFSFDAGLAFLERSFFPVDVSPPSSTFHPQIFVLDKGESFFSVGLRVFSRGTFPLFSARDRPSPFRSVQFPWCCDPFFFQIRLGWFAFFKHRWIPLKRSIPPFPFRKPPPPKTSEIN